MNELYWAISGFAIGMGSTATAFVLTQKHMAARVVKHVRLELLSDEIEKRRDAHDYGIDEAPRLDAGPAGDESSLFSTRPGALHLDNLARTNQTERLDSQQNSTTLDNASGSRDQPTETN